MFEWSNFLSINQIKGLMKVQNASKLLFNLSDLERLISELERQLQEVRTKE